jgi:hypothetical protein
LHHQPRHRLEFEVQMLSSGLYTILVSEHYTSGKNHYHVL